MPSPSTFSIRGIPSIALAITILAGVTSAQTSSDPETRRPLDLPLGLSVAADPEAPPESIDFYGSLREGDAFFFCIERSSLTACALAAVRQEVQQAIASLTSTTEFGIIAYHDAVVPYASTPRLATPTERADACVFLDQLVPTGMPVVGPAGVALLDLVHQSKASNKAVFFVGFGHQCYPDEALVDITDANYSDVPLNAIVVGTMEGVSFFGPLAELNDGTCEPFFLAMPGGD